MNLGDDGIYHPDPHRRWLNRRIRESDLAASAAAGRAADLTARIARRERESTATALEAAVARLRATTMDVVTCSSVGSREEWLSRLATISMTDPMAVDHLHELRRDADRVTHWLDVLASAPLDLPGSSRSDTPATGPLPWTLGDPTNGLQPTVPFGEEWRAGHHHRAREAKAISKALTDLIDALRTQRAARHHRRRYPSYGPRGGKIGRQVRHDLLPQSLIIRGYCYRVCSL